MTASLKHQLVITTITLLLFASTTIYGQCTATQLGDNIRFAQTFDEQVGFANRISSDGSTVIVGAVNGSIAGSRVGRVRVFSLSTSGEWTQKGQELSGISNQDRFGASVALNSNGNFAIIGATQTSGNQLDIGGYVTVFRFQSGVWQQMGQNINGLNPGDAFGVAVDISADGQTIIVGGSANDTGGLNAGITQVYTFNSTTMTWDLKGTAIIGNTASFVGAGTDVSISQDGNIIGVASNLNSRIFQFNTTQSDWVQKGGDIVDDGSQFFPSTLSLSGDGTTVAVGNSNFGSFTGDVSVYNFNNTNSAWEIIGSPILGNSEFRPLGASTSLNSDGTIVATGGTFYGPPIQNREKGSTLLYQIDTLTNVWNQLITPILGTERDERSGFSVDVSDDGLRVISGAILNSNDGAAFFGGQSVVYEIDIATCDGCSFSTDTTFASITIPCNSKFLAPKVLDTCADSLLCGVPLDSGFYFTQDAFMTQWEFTAGDGTTDTILQEIIVDGVVVCDTVSSGIGSLRNALECAEVGDTINIFEGLMNQTLILDGEGLTIDDNIIIEVESSDNITIDASVVPSAFIILPSGTLTLDGMSVIMGTASDGGVGVNNGILNILETRILPNPSNPGGSQFSGSGEINILPETIIFPN